MLKLPATVRVYLATAPCDMRRQHDGLAVLVRSSLGQDPGSGNLFVFWNRRRTMCKVLFVDGQGSCLLAKRLRRGTFQVPAAPEGGALELDLGAWL